MEFSSKGILESYRFWKQGRGDVPVAYHLVSHRLPNHWGYAVAGGVGECVRRMCALEEKGLRIELIRHTLENYLPADDRDEITSYLDYLQKLPFSFRADGVPDASVIFGSQPLMELIGPASLVALFAYNLAETLQAGINTATNFSRIRTVIGKESKLIDGLFQKSWISECAAFGSADELSSPVGNSGYPLIARAGAQSQSLTYAPGVTTFYPVEGVRYIDSLQTRPQALVISQRSLDGEFSEVRRALDENAMQDTEIWCSTEGLSIKNLKRLTNSPDKKPDGWIVEAYGLLRDVDSGSMSVSVALSAIELEGEWKVITRRLHGTAFRSYPGILNIQRYGSRKPEDEGGEWTKYLGDLIVNELEGGSDNLIEDSRFLNRRIVGESRSLFEPLVTGGKNFLFCPGLQQQAQWLQSELTLFDKAHLAVEFPTVYRAGLQQELYQQTLKS